MALHQACDVQALRDRRNEAQAELERYLLEQYPIDSEEKTLGVAMRARAVTGIEEEMRRQVIGPDAE
jgi:hypothetical protein